MSLIKTDQLTNLNDDGQVEVLKGIKISTGKKLSLQGPLGDASDSGGVSGQVLTSSASGVVWTNPADLNTQYSIGAEDGSSSNRKVVRLTSDGSPVQKFYTPTNVTYNPASGISTFTVPDHGLADGLLIKIGPESIVFTCAMDGDKTEHYLPGPGQSAYGTSLPISNVTTDTFDIDVGASGVNQQFTPTAAVYNPSTGDLVLTIGSHSLSINEGITIDDNSLSFTCDMDGDQAVKSYPRPGIDPFAGRSFKITSVGPSTITVNAGKSGPNKYFTPTAVNYNAGSGDMIVTVGQHGLGVGRSVVLEDNSFTFTCDYDGDGNTTPKTYPRPGVDPFAGKSIPITNVGSSSHTVTAADYDSASGNVRLTIANHGFNHGDYIKLDDDSLKFTCILDGNSAEKDYPRAGYDYPSGRWLAITSVTTNTFDIYIGSSNYEGAHTFVSAVTDGLKRQTGTFTINVGAAGVASGSTHQFVSATVDAIKHLPQSAHAFQGATSNSVKHLPQSVHTFRRSKTNSLAFTIAGGGIEDVEFGGDTNILLTRTGDRINFNLTQDVGTTSDVTFNNLTAAGNLSVTGDFNVGSDIVAGGALKTNSTSLVFNNDKTTGSPSENVNFIIKRGTSPTAELRWNEGEDRWQFTNDGLTYYNILLPDETDFGATEQYGASGDPTVYDVTPSTVTIDSLNYTRLTFNTANAYKNFQLNHRVKTFSASTTLVLPSNIADGGSGGAFEATRVAESSIYGGNGAPVSGYDHKYYTYWVAQYHIEYGDIGIATYTGDVVEHIETQQMNGSNYIKLELTRTSSDYGLLVYRGQYDTNSQAINDTSGQFPRLVAILGPQELGVNTSGIVFKDFGGYDIPSWTERENDGRYKSTLMHFPLTIPTSQKRGWQETGIKQIGVNFITLDANLTYELSGVKTVHDDTTGIQTVIDNALGSGQSYVFLPGGTFYVKGLEVPDGFTIKGLGDATVLKRQFFETSKINSAAKEGVKGTMIYSKNYNFTTSQFLGPNRFGMSDFILDGNKENNILFSNENNQATINIVNSELVSIQNMRIQNTTGPAIYGEAAKLVSIENTNFLYGLETERYSTPVCQFTDNENLKITDCVFFGFPGPLDCTTSQVVGVSASIIRNCGTGIRIYGAGKTNVLNNLILGPDDEWLPTPDIYDSDYNSVNYTITRSTTFTSPTFQYIESGAAKDLTNVTLVSHLFPITRNGNQEVRGSNILSGSNPMFQVQSSSSELAGGYIKVGIPAGVTSGLTIPGENELRGHEITGSQYISKGNDLQPTIQLGSYNASSGSYTITLNTEGEKYYEEIMVGDKVKLQSHNSTPNLSPYELTVAQKAIVGLNKTLRLTLPIGVSITTNGGNFGYIQVENVFVVARGIVGVI